MTLDPLTIASIELQGVDSRDDRRTIYRCGCTHWPQVDGSMIHTRHLCQYHDGFDDGVSAAKAAS